jgi:hypothetical protein
VTGPTAAEVAAILTLSGERDQWIKVGLGRERAAYRQGFTAGTAVGYTWARTEMAQRWTRIARPVAYGGPAFADLEERRWGAGGREAFGAPRAGDFQGRGKPAPPPHRSAPTAPGARAGGPSSPSPATRPPPAGAATTTRADVRAAP